MKYCNSTKNNFMFSKNDPFILQDHIAEIFFLSSHSRILTHSINDSNKEQYESSLTNIRVGRTAKHLQDSI